MPPKAIHKVAEADTPQAVTIPNNWAGVLTWAVGRFGGSALIIAGLAYGGSVVYQDNQRYNEKMIQVFERQAEAATNNANSMMQMKMALDALTTEAKIAHQKYSFPR